MPSLSIIIPTLNEAEGIAAQLAGLSLLRQRGHEVIVADGGSDDGTEELARPMADAVIHAPRGRAAQMNAGAACARGEVLLFLHADTWLPVMADELILGHLTVCGCHESTDNIPGRDVIRGLPYGAFIVRGVDTHRHGCWAIDFLLTQRIWALTDMAILKLGCTALLGPIYATSSLYLKI